MTHDSTVLGMEAEIERLRAINVDLKEHLHQTTEVLNEFAANATHEWRCASNENYDCNCWLADTLAIHNQACALLEKLAFDEVQP